MTQTNVRFVKSVRQVDIVGRFASDILQRGDNEDYKKLNDDRVDCLSILPLELWLHIMLYDPEVYLLLGYTCKDLRQLAKHPRNLDLFNRTFVFTLSGRPYSYEYQPCVCGDRFGSYTVEWGLTNRKIEGISFHGEKVYTKYTDISGGNEKVTLVKQREHDRYLYLYRPITEEHLEYLIGDQLIPAITQPESVDIDMDPVDNGGYFVEMMVADKDYSGFLATCLVTRVTIEREFHINRPDVESRYACISLYRNGIMVAECFQYKFLAEDMLHPSRQFLAGKDVVEQRFYRNEGAKVRFNLKEDRYLHIDYNDANMTDIDNCSFMEKSGEHSVIHSYTFKSQGFMEATMLLTEDINGNVRHLRTDSRYRDLVNGMTSYVRYIGTDRSQVFCSAVYSKKKPMPNHNTVIFNVLSNIILGNENNMKEVHISPDFVDNHTGQEIVMNFRSLILPK